MWMDLMCAPRLPERDRSEQRYRESAPLLLKQNLLLSQTQTMNSMVAH